MNNNSNNTINSNNGGQPVVNPNSVPVQPVQVSGVQPVQNQTQPVQPAVQPVQQAAAPVQPVQPAQNTTPIQVTQPTAVPTQQPVVAANSSQSAPAPTQTLGGTQPQGEKTKEEKTGIKNPSAFNNQEKVIFKGTEDVDSNPLVAFSVVGLMIVMLLFLPLIDNLLGNKVVFNVPTPAPQKGEETQPEDQRQKLNSSHTIIEFDKLEIRNIVTTHENDDYEVSFTLSNNSNETFSYNKKYYLIFYDEDTALYRALIHSYDPLASKAATQLTLIINERTYNRATSVEVKEIKTSLYTPVSEPKKEGDFEVLECNYKNNNVLYYFENKLLKTVRDTITTESTSSNYTNNKDNQFAESRKYNDIEGITSTFVESPSGYTYQNELDLNSIQDSTLSGLKVYKYFKYNEKIDIVAFEMTAKGYICS